MTLVDPREALADQSAFIGYLLGVAGVAQLVHELAADGDPAAEGSRAADDFVHVLLGLAALGEAVEALADATREHRRPEVRLPASSYERWLR
jgi:uncharacterized membrane protein HdeD (DUF308 family)